MKDIIKLLEKRRESINELLNSRKTKIPQQRSLELRGAIQELDFIIKAINDHNERVLDKKKDEHLFMLNENAQLNKLTELFSKKKTDEEKKDDYINKNLLIK
ncbi:MAG TPA: hypothetical protein VI894_03145 [Candidatus Nanoarchaeia archaeon]|nr:hypothetical protein [Candidatus Nanoarchaeia archaeon]